MTGSVAGRASVRAATRRAGLAPAVIGLALFALLSGCEAGYGTPRDQIRAVGSSTVYPFAKAVADSLAKSDPRIKSPIIEANGTGAGIKLFCKGVGANYPDIANASRRIRLPEYAECARNGVDRIVEIQVGLDGIAFAEAATGPSRFALGPVDIYKAIAARPFGRPNRARLWSDVNPALPSEPILVYGPPATSGTRDALKDLILARGCERDPAMVALKARDRRRYEATCTDVRRDGAYVDTGENDNLVVQKLQANPRAVGVFGYSYLAENADRLRGLTMDGVAPSYATIANFRYPGARPLYIYIKAAHLDAIPGLRAFVGEWVASWGPDGLLARQGMVVEPAAVREANARIAAAMTPLDPATLN